MNVAAGQKLRLCFKGQEYGQTLNEHVVRNFLIFNQRKFLINADVFSCVLLIPFYADFAAPKCPGSVIFQSGLNYNDKKRTDAQFICVVT